MFRFFEELCEYMELGRTWLMRNSTASKRPRRRLTRHRLGQRIVRNRDGRCSVCVALRERAWVNSLEWTMLNGVTVT